MKYFILATCYLLRLYLNPEISIIRNRETPSKIERTRQTVFEYLQIQFPQKT